MPTKTRQSRATPLTAKTTIYHDDGSTTEVETTPALAASIERLDWEEERAARKVRRHETTATDLGVRAEAWWETRRFVPRHSPRPGLLILGEGALWAGPDAQWLNRHGEPCQPGQEHRRCRFCSHLPTFPASATCLNDGCKRERRNRLG